MWHEPRCAASFPEEVRCATFYGGIVMSKNGSTKGGLQGILSLKIVCQLALLVALEIVFNRILSINTQALKIGFAFVPVVLCAVLFGPVHAAIVYALADVIGALMFPLGPLMPGLTLSCALMGAVHGLFLHGFLKSDSPPNYTSVKTWVRIVCPVVINCIALGLFLNTFWLSLIYTKGYIYFFTMRLVEYSVLVPVQLLVIPFIIKLSRRMKKAGLA